MENIKIVIADDDRPSRLILTLFIQVLQEYEVVAEAETGEELINLVMAEKPDIVLVDISMPGINGIEAVKVCREIHPDLEVVFTTGYDEYAVEAFNISAADYIMKPIEQARLFKALEKARKSLLLQYVERRRYSSKLAVKSYNTYLYLQIDDILYIEKERRKTILHTVRERFETSEALQELEEKLPAFFFKTHRSYLVNLKKINKIESYGETYLAYFPDSNKTAHISKLKINEVHNLMSS